MDKLEREKSPLEGKYVIVGYQSVMGDEELNTAFIYKITNNKSILVFGPGDFPDYEYSQPEDATFIEYILAKIKSLQISELFLLVNIHTLDYKRLPKEKMFGIDLGSKTYNVAIATEDDDFYNGPPGTEYASEWSETTHQLSPEVHNYLEEASICLKYFNVQSGEISEKQI